MSQHQYQVSRRKVEQILIDGAGGRSRVTVSKFRGWHDCDGGSLSITGDFGPWEYAWGSIGSETFGQFLSSLNKQYAMQKLAGERCYQFDGEATEKEVKRDILEKRRDESLNREEARKYFDQAEGISHETDANVAYAERQELLYGLYEGDPIACTDYRGSITTFWNEIWPLVVQEILNSEKENAALNAETAKTN